MTTINIVLHLSPLRWWCTNYERRKMLTKKNTYLRRVCVYVRLLIILTYISVNYMVNREFFVVHQQKLTKTSVCVNLKEIFNYIFISIDCHFFVMKLFERWFKWVACSFFCWLMEAVKTYFKTLFCEILTHCQVT